MSDPIQIITNLGVAVGGLIILVFGLWKAGRWFGAKVIMPVADRHIKFIDEISVISKHQSESILKIAAASEKTLENIERIVNKLDEVTHNVTDVKNVILKTESVQIVAEKK